MKEFTWVELLECYNEALEEYEHAVEDQMFDDEEHDKIESLRHDVEEIADEIFRRIQERKSLENRLNVELN